MTRILGISAFYHDSAAALITDGRITAAMQEERFSRIKHDSAFPEKAIQACLDMGGLKLSDIDYVVFYEKPFSKFERLLENYEKDPNELKLAPNAGITPKEFLLGMLEHNLKVIKAYSGSVLSMFESGRLSVRDVRLEEEEEE